MNFDREREDMVKFQLKARGIGDQRVLQAFREVPREIFVPDQMREFAYEDSPLPIGREQTISQPYIVARMVEALELEAGDRVLDVGTGSGYAAAVLSRIAGEVYSIERVEELARQAEKRLERLGYNNVHVKVGDGSRGLAEHAPYDAIVVAAGGSQIPQPLLDQLAEGGSLIIPVGATPRLQELLRVRRTRSGDVVEERLGGVRFVPLIGEAGWTEQEQPPARKRPEAKGTDAAAVEAIRRQAEALSSIAEAHLDRLLERIGDARLVLLGEASHGTAEFYEMRARITRELIEKKGFDFVAVEADWPDAAAVDRFVRNAPAVETTEKFFTRFPRWMWANESVLAFLQWLRDYNQKFSSPEEAVGFHGLDIYSLYSSIEAVLNYLDQTDPESARIARQRYGCLSPFAGDPSVYGASALTGRYRECEEEVVAMLQDILKKQPEYSTRDGWRFMDAAQNARLIASAEKYYRIMYYGGRSSWNLRDRHMFETLKTLLNFRGSASRAVVWAHNSHLGDAAATEMGGSGEINVGHLCRKEFGEAAFLVGFGTDRGTVAAASDWEGPMEIKQVRPAHPASYERLCRDAGIERFLLPLKGKAANHLAPERLERAIGVLYIPETELQSHYFRACLPRQFDEYVWFEQTQAVTPLGPETARGMPDTYPFGV